MSDDDENHYLSLDKDKIIKHTSEIFSLKIYQNSKQFLDLFPLNDINEFPDVYNLSYDDILKTLKIELPDSISRLSYILTDLKKDELSVDDKNFISFIALWNFSSLFFCDIDKLDFEESELFTNSLLLSLDLNNNVYDLTLKSYVIFISRITYDHYFLFNSSDAFLEQCYGKQCSPFVFEIFIPNFVYLHSKLQKDNVQQDDNKFEHLKRIIAFTKSQKEMSNNVISKQLNAYCNHLHIYIEEKISSLNCLDSIYYLLIFGLEIYTLFDQRNTPELISNFYLSSTSINLSHSDMNIIKTLLHTEKSAAYFLENLKDSLNQIPVQILKLVNNGFIKILLSQIPEYSNIVYQLALDVISEINSFSCNRESMDEFLLFYNKIPCTMNERKIIFLSALNKSIENNKNSKPFMFYFNTAISTICIHDLHSSILTSGFSLVFEIFFLKEFSEQSKLPIFSATSNSNNLFIYLTYQKIIIDSSYYSSPVQFSLIVPLHRWFKLKIYFKTIGEVFVQLDNEQFQMDLAQLNPSIVEENLNNMEVTFLSNGNDSLNNFECLISKILMFENHLSNDVLSECEDYSSIVFCITSKYVNIFSQKLPIDELIQTNAYSISISNIDLYNYYYPFSHIFEHFAGIKYIIFYFSQFKTVNDEYLKSNFQELFSKLIVTLETSFKGSLEIQKQFYRYNGFGLISYFCSQFFKSYGYQFITKEFWMAIISLENVIQFEKLLQNYYSSLIINFSSWEHSNDDILDLVLNKWIALDSKFFIEQKTFVGLCFTLNNIFHEKKNIGKNIINLIVGLLIHVSENFDEKEIKVLCLFTSEILENLNGNNKQIILSLLQAIKAIISSQPRFFSTAVGALLNDEKINQVKDPSILIAIIQLFTQDDMKTNIFLLRKQILIHRDYNEITMFLTYLCFALIGKKADQSCNLNAIKFQDRTYIPSLLPFILAFSFQASSQTIEKVTNFLLQILRNDECLSFIAKTIDPITLFLLLAYSVVISKRLMRFLIEIISQNILLFSDSCQILDILAEEEEISADGDYSIHDYKAAITQSVLLRILNDGNWNHDKSVAYTIIQSVICSLCYGVNRNAFYDSQMFNIFQDHEINDIQPMMQLSEMKKKERRLSFLLPSNSANIIRVKGRRSSFANKPPELFIALNNLIQKRFALNPMIEKLKRNDFKKKKQTFGFVFKNNDWADARTAGLLMNFFDNPDFDLMDSSYAQLCVILSFLCHSKLVCSSSNISNLLNKVADKYNVGCSFLSPLIFEVSSHIEDFQSAKKFISKFKPEIGIGVELFEAKSNVLKSFIETLHPTSNVGEKLEDILNFEYTEKVKVDTVINYFSFIKEKYINDDILNEKKFQKLEYSFDKLINGSNTNNSPQEKIVKRYNLFDENFRPFLYVNCISNISYFNDSNSLIVNTALDQNIWSSPCQRIKLDRSINGIFIVKKEGFYFSTSKDKSFLIPNEYIQKILWNYYHHLPCSFTLVTTYNKCYLFRFLDESLTRDEILQHFLQNIMCNCILFQQDEPSSEIEKIKLIQRWRQKKISNFDYIMNLNIFSGRSFLDIESYPIFPILFFSDDSSNDLNIDSIKIDRNLTQNICVCLSSEIAECFRERRISDSNLLGSSVCENAYSNSKYIKRMLPLISQVRSNSVQAEPFNCYQEILQEVSTGKIQSESIPEIFFLPEVFTHWQNISDKFNPIIFTLKHQLAFESDEISKSLNKWIDLIWGASQNINHLFDQDLESTVWDVFNESFTFSKSLSLNSITNHEKLLYEHGASSLNSFQSVGIKDERKEKRRLEIHKKLSSKGQLPKKLFTGPHPAQINKETKININIRQKINIIFSLHNSNQVLAIDSIGDSYKNLTIFSYHKDGTVSITYSNQNQSTLHVFKDFNQFIDPEIVKFAKDFLIMPLHDGFLNVDNLFGLKCLTSKNVNGSRWPHLSSIKCIDLIEINNGDHLISTGSADSSIVLWNGTGNSIVPIKSLIEHKNPIISIRIVKVLNGIFAIDSSGLVSISVFPILKFVKSFNTDISNVDLFDITSNSIICFKGADVFNFTLNGTKVIHKNFGFNIIAECSIEQGARKDMVAISTSLNEIITINTISLQAKSLLVHHTSLITLMKYNKSSDALVCYTKSNEIIIVPILE